MSSSFKFNLCLRLLYKQVVMETEEPVKCMSHNRTYEVELTEGEDVVKEGVVRRSDREQGISLAVPRTDETMWWGVSVLKLKVGRIKNIKPINIGKKRKDDVQLKLILIFFFIAEKQYVPSEFDKPTNSKCLRYSEEGR